MQCESTPRRQAHEDLVTPRSTAVQQHEVHKRSSMRKSLQDDPNIRAIINHIDTSPFNRRPTLRTTKQKESAPDFSFVQQPAKNAFRSREPTEDVFFDHELELTSQSGGAALRFHNDAIRLALESLSTGVKHDFTKDRTDRPASKQIDGSVTPCNFSKRFQPNPASARPKRHGISQERDITSARRDTFNNHAYKNNFTTPVRRQKHGGLHTPVSAQNQSGDVRAPAQRSLLRTRNFSRPNGVAPKQRQQQPLNLKQVLPQATAPTSAQAKPSQIEDNIRPTPETPIRPRNSPPTPKDSAGSSDVSSPTIAPIFRQNHHNSHETSPIKNHSVTDLLSYVRAEDIIDRRRQLKHWQIWLQRIAIMFLVVGANVTLGLAYFRSQKHPYLLAILVFMKSKDILSTIADLLGILHHHFHRLIWPPKEPESRWILCLVCAYAETEEQIMKTVMSLVKSDTRPHKQVICIILDGKPRDVLSRMSTVKVDFERPYVTWRGARGELNIYAGTIEDTPVILIQKLKNAGKKDSLILGHDLFNYPRKDMPHSTRLLREEIWQLTLPHLVSRRRLTSFDFIFCTDADSTIHEKCLQRLANSLCQTKGAVAGCGVLFAELGDGWTEFSPWHLFQQFQYTFGQYVRRQAESTFGRVTCLPGCVTMIVVRPELGDALSEYARPVSGRNLLRHQVQYLGTDRRLTWCMLSQNKHLRTIFVPDALSETVTPSSLSHYLSQRRRWASNAYFNDWFYFLGPQQRLATRLFAAIDIVRLTLVFYRVFNTGYFLRGLATNFYIIKIIPTLIVTKTPATWYLILVLLKEPVLRKRLHKILLGMCINQIISPILSVIVFTNVLLHVGSQAWGKTGASTQGKLVATINHNVEPAGPWTPRRLAKSVRQAIRGVTPKVFAMKGPKPAVSSLSGAPTPRKQERVKHAAPSQAQPATSKANHTNNHAINVTPTASTSSLDSIIKSKSETPAVEPTPARILFQNGFPTPSTLLRRAPHGRNRRNRSPNGTPTKNQTADPEVDLDVEP